MISREKALELESGFLQLKIKQLEETITRIEGLREHYRSIGFCDTAEKIRQALEEKAK